MNCFERDLYSHFASPRHDLVLVASYFETLASPFHSNNSHIGESDLIGGSEDRHGAQSRPAL